MKEWFKARNVWIGAFSALSDAEAGRLAKALWAYTATGEQVELSGNEKGCFAMILYTLQMDEKENAEISAKRAANGSRGGKQRVANQANANFAKQNEANEANKNIEKEEDIKETTLKSGKEKRSRFSAPTLEQVADYCKERGNSINPQTFVDYYESRGWRVGSSNSPMKDWRACVRTWENREKATPQQQPKPLRAQMYEQREYHENEMQEILGVHDLYKELAQ